MDAIDVLRLCLLFSKLVPQQGMFPNFIIELSNLTFYLEFNILANVLTEPCCCFWVVVDLFFSIFNVNGQTEN